MSAEGLAAFITSCIVMYGINGIFGYWTIKDSINEGYGFIEETIYKIKTNKFLLILSFIFPIWIIGGIIVATLVIALLTCWLWIPVVIYNIILMVVR